MITFLAMLLIVLIGVALSIFGVVATIAGLFWLLWPLMIVVGALILVGYLIGKKKAKKETEEPIADAEFKEVDESKEK